MSMTLEKKIAIASVALCLLTPLALLLLYFEFTNSYEITSLRIQVFFEILAWFWGPMIASFILYTRLRSAAVTASALLAFALYALLSCLLGKDGGGLVGELIWLLYSIWGAACFVLSSLIVLFKPAILSAPQNQHFSQHSLSTYWRHL